MFSEGGDFAPNRHFEVSIPNQLFAIYHSAVEAPKLTQILKSEW